MKEITIGASQFRSRCLGILNRVAEKRETVVITKRGRAVAKLVPIPDVRESLMGRWRGTVKIQGDIVHSDASDDWEALR
jgi:prevent-host-death family protein